MIKLDNEIYKKGIDFALEQMATKENRFKEVSEIIKDQQGEEACNEFSNGYYKALTYYTYAIGHFKDSPEHLKEVCDHLQELHGEDIKNAFLKGVEYYKTHVYETPYYKRSR